ncbi:hypothetical protein ABPG72_021327 [Tetrahymena utriculariae]
MTHVMKKKALINYILNGEEENQNKSISKQTETKERDLVNELSFFPIEDAHSQKLSNTLSSPNKNELSLQEEIIIFQNNFIVGDIMKKDTFYIIINIRQMAKDENAKAYLSLSKISKILSAQEQMRQQIIKIGQQLNQLENLTNNA